MISGRSWLSKDKKLPGVYIKFVSKKLSVGNSTINPNTSSTLGVAILGKMILGTQIEV